jgi:hypothetical protein
MNRLIFSTTILTVLSLAACSKDDDNVKDNSIKVEYDSHAVDLGLPSGLKWSDQNLGANTPQEYGEYYAWGSLEPLSSFDSESYYAEVDVKNIPANFSGNVDFDPVARNIGGEWRTPNYAEIRELQNNTTAEWTTQEGVKGLKLTGPNGNSIFIPAGGQKTGDITTKEGFQGTLWSSSQDSGYEGFGLAGIVNAAGFGGTGGYGYIGYNIRPVRK